jgi:hypothetical protein
MGARLVAALLATALPALAAAEKSNQIRPTPSPVQTPDVQPGELVLLPRILRATYVDSIAVKGHEQLHHDYDITSYGVNMGVQWGALSWLSVEGTVEAYQKLGTITGPSPGNVRFLTEADVVGNAFKGSVQLTAMAFRRGDWKKGGVPAPLDFTLWGFGRAIGDFFRQAQVEPLYRTDFLERSFDYRGGLAVHLHLWNGIYLAPFGGAEGVIFSGERQDLRTGGVATVTAIGGTEGPYPFVGADLLWAPLFLGFGFDEAISLGAVLSNPPEEEEGGFGGSVLTFNLGWTPHL